MLEAKPVGMEAEVAEEMVAEARARPVVVEMVEAKARIPAAAMAEVKVQMAVAGIMVVAVMAAGKGGNGGGHDGRGLASLKTVTVPGPTAAELANIIQDKNAAIALGKAFFWEMQFGSDGKTACATCHFNAGADSRTANQADPGQRRVDANGFPAADSNTFYLWLWTKPYS